MSAFASPAVSQKLSTVHANRTSPSPATMSRRSIIDVADDAGILSMNPSDLVFEANQMGVQYYDFVLSAASTADNGYQLYLVKFDTHTNVEWLETARVGPEIITNNGIPDNDLSMMTLGILLWKHKIVRSRVLCLVKSLNVASGQALEALKRATNKFKCLHHVQTKERRNSATSISSRCRSPHDGMRLRVMMCQTRSTVDFLPAQAIRETRCLLVPSSNPILCLCFPIS